MRNRVVILAATITMIVGMLACSTGGLLSRTEATATPTKTPKPTFTVTATPTQTPIPTNTPLPTDTATPTPLPTHTPIVLTATFTPVPTDIPLPTDTVAPPTNTPKPKPTATRKPKRKPTATKKPQPTNTPQPRAWRGEIAGTFPNCGYTGVFGYTLDRGGGIAGGIWVHYWADGWEGDWTQSSWTEDKGQSWEGDEKNWDGFIANYPRPGVWYACVVAQEGDWNCISEKMAVQTVAEPCAPGSDGIQVVRIVFQQN